MPSPGRTSSPSWSMTTLLHSSTSAANGNNIPVSGRQESCSSACGWRQEAHTCSYRNQECFLMGEGAPMNNLAMVK